ncbi:MAG: hypothetical protein QXE31_03955 [Candidatus Woesearchaeota archaeon]
MKKAVSPLIATVILLVGALVIGTVVLNFSERSTKEITDSASNAIEKGVKCNNLIFKLVNLEKNPCYNRSFSKNLEFVIENQGSNDASGLIVSVFDFEGTPYNFKIFEVLSAHNREKYNLSLSENFKFPPEKIIISPIISFTSNEINVCSDNRLEIEEIERC